MCKPSSFTLEILVINKTASHYAVLLMLWKHPETSDKIKAISLQGLTRCGSCPQRPVLSTVGDEWKGGSPSTNHWTPPLGHAERSPHPSAVPPPQGHAVSICWWDWTFKKKVFRDKKQLSPPGSPDKSLTRGCISTTCSGWHSRFWGWQRLGHILANSKCHFVF